MGFFVLRGYVSLNLQLSRRPGAFGTKEMSVFYETYGASKSYTTPSLNAKHIRKFEAEVWQPAGADPTMRCLEVGCGTGHFLSFMKHKGVADFTGIDLDASLGDVVPDDVRDHFQATDVAAFLKNDDKTKRYDRIFMFDVFEHFTPEDGLALLLDLQRILTDDGAIILKMPNASSPWGLQFQHGDLTHLAQYTPDSIRQMANAAGMVCTSCYPHLLGSPGRRRTDRMVQIILEKLVATPPEIWEGNFYAILQRLDPGASNE